MGFNRDVIRRRRDEMHELGVRVRWAGRAPRLWKSVIKELQVAEELTRDNDVLTLTMCVNYGGRAELADAARSIAREVAAGRLDPDKIDERTFAQHLYVPELSDADLVWRTSGEQRLSNFMLWQAAYSELVFTDVLWPDVDRRHLWQAVEHLRRAATAATAARCPTRPDPYAAASVPGAGAEDLQRVGDVGEAVLGGDRVGPALDGRPLDLDGRAALAADEVVVVRVRAAAVDRLAVLGPQHVDLAALAEPLEGAVDRRQPDLGAAPVEEVVDLLGAAEVVERREGLGHGDPLPGGAQGLRGQCSS